MRQEAHDVKNQVPLKSFVLDWARVPNVDVVQKREPHSWARSVHRLSWCKVADSTIKKVQKDHMICEFSSASKSLDSVPHTVS